MEGGGRRGKGGKRGGGAGGGRGGRGGGGSGSSEPAASRPTSATTSRGRGRGDGGQSETYSQAGGEAAGSYQQASATRGRGGGGGGDPGGSGASSYAGSEVGGGPQPSVRGANPPGAWGGGAAPPGFGPVASQQAARSSTGPGPGQPPGFGHVAAQQAASTSAAGSSPAQPPGYGPAAAQKDVASTSAPGPPPAQRPAGRPAEGRAAMQHVGSSSAAGHAPAGTSRPARPQAAPGMSVDALASMMQSKFVIRGREEPFCLRPGFGRAGQPIVVRANHYLARLSRIDPQLYDVSIEPPCKNRGVNRAVIETLVRTFTRELGGRRPAYDGQKGLYTAGLLPFEQQEFLVELPEMGDRPPRQTGPRQFRVTITHAGSGNIEMLMSYMAGRVNECSYNTIQALDVALRQSLLAHYIPVGRSLYGPNFGRGEANLGGGVTAYGGFFQSLRPTQSGPTLNIDSTATAFLKPLPLLDFVAEFLNLRGPLAANFQLLEGDRRKLEKVLRRAKLELTHYPHPRKKVCEGLTREGVGECSFTLDEETGPRESTVAAYFAEHYQIRARPRLAGVKFAKGVIVPMEVCRVVANQPYGRKLNAAQTTEILRYACLEPQIRERAINEVVTTNRYNEDPMAQEFGVTVSQEMLRVNGRVLPAPALRYHNGQRINPRDGKWNMMSARVADGGSVAEWGIISLEGRCGPRDLEGFMGQLGRRCVEVGMRAFSPQPVVPPVIVDVRRAPIDAVLGEITALVAGARARLQRTAEQKAMDVLFVVLPNRDKTYDEVKRLCDTQIKVMTQCLLSKNVPRPNSQYLANLALKINVKVGGRNVFLEPPGRATPQNLDYLTDVPTIIFGADVSHPSPGDVTSPSVAGVVANVDWPECATFLPVMRAQRHRVEIIQDLHRVVRQPNGQEVDVGIISMCLRQFYQRTRRQPARLLFYRDGVSEGMFEQVVAHELDSIKKACAQLSSTYDPKVTFVVVARGHHTRFFMEGGRGNVPPGLVVDRDVCHPTQYDFYLNSHAAIKGTNRPAHYHVLYDENKFPPDKLHELTNKFCYTYARCTRAVAVASPAYYADRVATRGRMYLEADSRSDSASMA